jgi:hypothetical protein
VLWTLAEDPDLSQKRKKVSLLATITHSIRNNQNMICSSYFLKAQLYRALWWAPSDPVRRGGDYTCSVSLPESKAEFGKPVSFIIIRRQTCSYLLRQ